jgi:uncharacterized membrane-anchored protein
VRKSGDVSSLSESQIALGAFRDIDAATAQALIDAKVRAVLNTQPSSSGATPNIGPQVLTQAGILLLDITDHSGWGKLKSGDEVRIDGGAVYLGDEHVASGTVIDEQTAERQLAAAKEAISNRLDAIAANVSDHIDREQIMLLTGATVPPVRTVMADRAVVVVSSGYDDEADLKGLKRYIRENDPVLIGAGAGADILLAEGYKPHLVIGALENISDRAIRTAGEVVVTTSSGTVINPERLERHGKQIVTFVSTGADDDLAIVLADTHEAGVIIHAGGPATMRDFIERAPSEAARMFTARLRAGSRIVDAKAVGHFTSQRISLWPVLLLLLAAVIAVGAAISITPVGQDWFESLGENLTDLGSWIKGLFK